MNRIRREIESSLDASAKEMLLQQATHLSQKVRNADIVENFLILELEEDEVNIQQDLDELIYRTVRSYKKARIKVEFRNKGAPVSTWNPMKFLESTCQVVASAPGIFSYQGDYLKIVQKLDVFFLKIAKKHGAIEQSYGTVLPIDSMVKNGYLGSFPHHALLVNTFHQDLDQLSKASKTKDSSEVELIEKAPPRLMLAPTVCHHCFELNKGIKFGSKNQMVTAVGKCHRFEGNSVDDLSRTHVFTMREYIFFGDPNWIVDRLSFFADEIKSLFINWDLCFQIQNATDPFFPVNNEGKRSFQLLRNLKKEVLLTLPYKERNIACVSLNNHQKTLINAYAISSDQSQLSSGCIGFGYERLALALFAQCGKDLTKWPTSIIEDLGLNQN